MAYCIISQDRNLYRGFDRVPFRDQYERYIYLDYCSDALYEDLIPEKEKDVTPIACNLKIRVDKQEDILITPSSDIALKIYNSIYNDRNIRNIVSDFAFYISECSLVELVVVVEMREIVIAWFKSKI